MSMKHYSVHLYAGDYFPLLSDEIRLRKLEYCLDTTTESFAMCSYQS